MSSYEMRVMPLGRLHRIVTEQLLDGANVGALREQLDSKRIAEPMRVRVLDSGQRTEALNRAPHILRARVCLSASRPEKVGGVPGRHRDQRFDSIGVKCGSLSFVTRIVTWRDTRK
jgi:hypothetical protein